MILLLEYRSSLHQANVPLEAVLVESMFSHPYACYQSSITAIQSPHPVPPVVAEVSMLASTVTPSHRRSVRRLEPLISPPSLSAKRCGCKTLHNRHWQYCGLVLVAHKLVLCGWRRDLGRRLDMAGQAWT